MYLKKQWHLSHAILKSRTWTQYYYIWSLSAFSSYRSKSLQNPIYNFIPLNIIPNITLVILLSSTHLFLIKKMEIASEHKASSSVALISYFNLPQESFMMLPSIYSFLDHSRSTLLLSGWTEWWKKCLLKERLYTHSSDQKFINLIIDHLSIVVQRQSYLLSPLTSAIKL